jgi:transcriptional regulator GlxA family with amidase domain
MPILLRTNIAAMFTHRPQHTSARALARSSAMTCRSLSRWLARTGIRSAHLLIASARLCAASDLLLHSSVSLARIAGSLGYGDTRGLDRHCCLLLGMDTNTARQSLSEDQMALRICSRLLCRPTDDG